jgi:hypothetical protein
MRRIVNALCVGLLLFFGAYLYAQEPGDNRKLQQEEQKPSKAEHEKPSKQENAKPAHEGQGRKTAEANQGHERAGKSAHIPDDKFRAHFGRQHTFVVNRPVIVEGQPRFQYASYWFEIVDPWPVGWAYTDSCYIDFIDGEYFLFDLLHPGVRVAVFVVD